MTGEGSAFGLLAIPSIMFLLRIGIAPLGAMTVFLTTLFYTPSLFALQVPKGPEGRVSDYARLLTPAARSRLEAALSAFEQKTSNQVVVVTFTSLEGESLEDFSIRLAEKWKIGQKGKDNGVILLIFKEDRAVRIEVGYGLEGALTDATAKLIIENEIVPHFRQGKFDEGVESAVQAILLATQGEYRSEPNLFSNKKNLEPALWLGIFLGILLPISLLWLLFATGIFLTLVALVMNQASLIPYIFLLCVAPLLFHLIFGRGRRGNATFSGRGYRSGGSSFGGGWSGGGFSGGGGSFGGGGASGRW